MRKEGGGPGYFIAVISSWFSHPISEFKAGLMRAQRELKLLMLDNTWLFSLAYGIPEQ
jgi:hypothetical protein